MHAPGGPTKITQPIITQPPRHARPLGTGRQQPWRRPNYQVEPHDQRGCTRDLVFFFFFDRHPDRLQVFDTRRSRDQTGLGASTPWVDLRGMFEGGGGEIHACSSLAVYAGDARGS